MPPAPRRLPMKTCLGLSLIGIVLLASRYPLAAQNLADVPGVVVHHVPAPTWWQQLLGRAVYTASPSIAVLPNGDYVISSNLFGRGSGAKVSGTTLIHRSQDRGETWRHLTTLDGMKRGSLFVHNGALYLWGYRAAPGDILIRRSPDGGESWTVPENEANGLLRPGTFGGTPCNPVVHEGRLWIALGGKRIISAPADADLLNAESWTLSRSANTDSGPLGKGLVVTEAQVVASPRTGVVILPKVGGKPYTVLIRAGERPDQIRQPKNEDWIPLPGGEKKFGALHDPVSDRFYVLSNPVLPEYANRGWPPELVRNVAALLSSADLRDWRIERVFLHSPNVDYEAFQYLNFAIDGEDLVIASRTAYDVGGRKPPRGHDSNLITFHRLEQFRHPE